MKIDYLNKYTQKHYNKDYEECDKDQKDWAELYWDDLCYDAECEHYDKINEVKQDDY